MPELPRGWESKTLRDAALPGRENFIDGDWIEAPYITDAGIRLIQTGNLGVGSFIDKPETRKYISAASYRILNCTSVNAGDVLICRLADPIGRACEVPPNVGEAITAVDCTITRVDRSRYDKSFLLHWLNSDHNLKAAADMAAGSTRSRISRSNLGRLPLPRPPLDEQVAVGRVLDALDHIIRQTEAIIEKLKQVKQGLLHDLLTRGIDANGELRPPQSQAPHLYKDSPLGWIPITWSCARLAEQANVTVAYVGPTNPFYTTAEHGVLFLRTGNITGRGIDLGDVRWVTTAFHLAQQKSALRDGDVVVSRVGYTGTAAVVEGLGETNAANMIIIRPQPSLGAHWVRRLFGMDIFARQVSGFTAGSAQPVLNIQLVERLQTPVPPLWEQTRILEVLGNIDLRLEAERRTQSKLLSQKSGLMDDLLSGRVRVTPLLS